MNARQGVSRLEPTMSGQSHDMINPGVQFLMKEQKGNVDCRTYSMQTGMETTAKSMFTQMQASLGFKVFEKKAIAAMVKELKQLEFGPMPGKKVIMAVNPDTLSIDDKKHALNAVNFVKEKGMVV